MTLSLTLVQYASIVACVSSLRMSSVVYCP